MKSKLAVLVTVVAVLSLALVGTSLAAGPDPEAQPGPGQGVLEVKTLDNEITVAYQGTGYNIHRYSTLRLAVDPGQNDFDYFCGNTKYFVGDVLVQAGGTTTITLQPGKCDLPKVSKPYDPVQAAYNAGFADGLNCVDHSKDWSLEPLEVFMAYQRGLKDGEHQSTCPI